MKLRAMVAALAVAAGTTVLSSGPAHAVANCQATQVAPFTTANWSNNCLTSTTSNKDSNLTLAVQRILKTRGYAITSMDGIFGPQTVAAVKVFQRDNGLAQDGKVGPNTWKALAKQIRWTSDTDFAYIYDVFEPGGRGREYFRLWYSTSLKGKWEVLEHAQGCGPGGDGYTLLNSTRDCG